MGLNPANWAIVDKLQGQNNQKSIGQETGWTGSGGGASWESPAPAPAPVAPAYNPYAAAQRAESARIARERSATEAYLADQEAMARQAQGRLGQQRQIGQQNIEGSYTTALNDLIESAAKAQRDYELTSGRNREDNVSARAATDQSVNAMSSGLQRLLGSRGAGNSSAAQILAPFAVAKQGASRLGEIQGTYGRNMQNLDTSYGDVKSEEQKQREALAREKQLKAQELEAGLSQAEIGILQQLSGLGLERARLNDQNYNDIRSSAQGYNNQISSLLDRINSLGSQYQGAVKPLAGVRFSAPELAQYNTSALSSGRAQQAGVPSPVADLVGQYFPTLLGEDRKREQQ